MFNLSPTPFIGFVDMFSVLDGELSFFSYRGDVGWTIRGWIFPNLSDRHCTDRSIDVFWLV